MSIGGCEVSQRSCHDVKLSGGATSLLGISVQHRQRAGEPLGFSRLLSGTIEGAPRKAMVCRVEQKLNQRQSLK